MFDGLRKRRIGRSCQSLRRRPRRSQGRRARSHAASRVFRSRATAAMKGLRDLRHLEADRGCERAPRGGIRKNGAASPAPHHLLPYCVRSNELEVAFARRASGPCPLPALSNRFSGCRSGQGSPARPRPIWLSESFDQCLWSPHGIVKIMIFAAKRQECELLSPPNGKLPRVRT
jgi:hypothetical protein